MKLFKNIGIIALATTILFGSAAAVKPTAVLAAEKKLSGKVVVAGSSALLPLTQQAAKEFKKKYPKVSIPASAAGSITGPQSVEKGAADIGACDWNATQDVPGFKAFAGQVAHPVAVIPFATIVHKDVKVDNLTKDQLVKIFTGKITNWKEVGGADAKIVVINRSFGSGTRVNYEMKALGGESIKKSDDKNTYKEVGKSGEMLTNVANTPNSIGYIDLVYVNDTVKAIKYEGVEPTVENVKNGKYPIWGVGYYLTKGEPKGATKAFIEYVQSKEFQQGSVKKMKFIPISEMKDQIEKLNKDTK
jgi:phosphate transport system substrate-binding protein